VGAIIVTVRYDIALVMIGADKPNEQKQIVLRLFNFNNVTFIFPGDTRITKSHYLTGNIAKVAQLV